MTDKLFGALLAAGLLLSIGNFFTSQSPRETCALTGASCKGSALYTIFNIMNQCGSALFHHLAPLFVIGCAARLQVTSIVPDSNQPDNTGDPNAPTSAKIKGNAVMSAHMNGTVLPMTEVQDEVFSARALGEGAAIEPTEGKLYAPADAVVGNLFNTHHAISLVTEEGVQLLLHIGINTVELDGRHFKAQVQTGQKVKRGDLLISFDLETVKAAGYLCTTPMIVCNTDDYQRITPMANGRVKAGAPLLELKGRPTL